MTGFPVYRSRRLRCGETLRRMVRETTLSVNDLIYPLFLVHGQNVRKEISAMPGQYHLSIDQLPAEVDELSTLGVPAVLLFGLPEMKDACGSEDYDPDGIVQQGIRAIKAANPQLAVITDICMCEYTDHGHCGILRDKPAHCKGKGLPHSCLDNDATLEYLARVAVSHAAAGADIVAPSDMMDGRVGAIRTALDREGYECVAILSYAAKFASAFYGPFRTAADSTPQDGDRRGYQMDPANVREALREVEMDIDEGADMVMVKPALPYLDVIRAVRDRFDLPLAAYNVSGEYSMLKAAAAQGWLDERRCALEMLTAIKRAGADLIITYWAKDAVRWLAEDNARLYTWPQPSVGTPGTAQHCPRRQCAGSLQDFRSLMTMSAMNGGPASDLLDREKLLLTVLQDRFPLADRPFAAIGHELGCPEDAAIGRTRGLKEAGIVRQIGAIFDTRRLGYTSALIACEVDPERLVAVGQDVSRHAGVSHNYARDHRLNLWFTLAVPPGQDLAQEAARLTAQPGVHQMLLLPTVRAFKIDVRFDFGGLSEPSSLAEVVPDSEPLAPSDVPLVRALQNDLPLLAEPFAALGAPFGLDAAALLDAAHRFRQSGIMRRYGATMRHRAAGFEANAMVCWEVDPERVEEAGLAAAEHRGVSHCYERPVFSGWPFQLFTMLHARTPAELAREIDDLHAAIRPARHAVLNTVREFKKVRLRYFDESSIVVEKENEP